MRVADAVDATHASTRVAACLALILGARGRSGRRLRRASMDDYLARVLQVGPADIAKFRAEYLE
jgi:hypothetical protein